MFSTYILVAPLILLLTGWHSWEASAEKTSANSKLQQVASASETMMPDSVYPDYCWSVGLENRILLEYPSLSKLINQHHRSLYTWKDLKAASQGHREIFKRIYLLELRKLSGKHDKMSTTRRPVSCSLASEEFGAEPEIDEPRFRAAYKLYDLWANTPGDFEHRQDDYANYLDSYLVQSRVEFWSYCVDDPVGCRDVLSQLIALAEARELGPLELLQISINIIMLINSHKADLLLQQLTDRGVIRLLDGTVSGADNNYTSQAHMSANDTASQQTNGSESLEDIAYDRKLEDIVKLLETDDDFNEATFNYVFTKGAKVHRIIDGELEVYLADRISQMATDET